MFVNNYIPKFLKMNKLEKTFSTGFANILLTIFFSMFFLGGYAQTGNDVIVTIDGDEIPALIIKKDDNTIFYKDPKYPTGLTLEIPRNQVKEIRDKNGNVEVINSIIKETEITPEEIEEIGKPVITFLSPSENAQLSGNKRIAVKCKVLHMNNQRVTLSINGRTESAKVVQNSLTLNPLCKNGKNTFTVTANNNAGTTKETLNVYWKKSESNPLKLGLKLGLTNSQYMFEVGEEDASGNASGKFGLAAGLQLEKMFNSAFGLRLEGLFLKKGYTSSVYDKEFDLSTNNINLGLLGIIKVNGNNTNGGLYFSIGPTFDLLQNGEAFFGTEEKEVTFRDVDTGLNVGIGYYFFDKLGFDFRYIHGLGNIESQFDTNLINEQTYSRTFIVGLSYYFLN